MTLPVTVSAKSITAAAKGIGPADHRVTSEKKWKKGSARRGAASAECAKVVPRCVKAVTH